MTQVDLAEASRVDSRTIGRAENGHAIKAETAADLSAALAQKLNRSVNLSDARRADALLQDLLMESVLSETPSLPQTRSVQTIRESGQIGDEHGSIDLEQLYVTRDCETDILNSLLHAESTVFVTGPAGSGKTSVLWRIASRLLRQKKAVYLFRAEYVISEQGRTELETLPVLTNDTAEGYILVDTIDAVVNSTEARTRLAEVFATWRAKGYRIGAACRSIEKNRYFPSDQSQKIPSEYSDAEFARVVESHVRAFYHLRDAETIAKRVEEVMAITSGSRPVASIALQPLLLRMLFVVFAPLEIPTEINSTTLYLEYWRKRVETDWRAGRPEPEVDSRNFGEDTAWLANKMLRHGRLQLTSSEISLEASRRPQLSKSVNDLVARGVLQRVSISGEGDGVQFFHQTFFEFSAAWSLMQTDGQVSLTDLYDHLTENAFDSLRVPVLESALPLAKLLGGDFDGDSQGIMLQILEGRTEHLMFSALSAAAQAPYLDSDLHEVLRMALDERGIAVIYIGMSSSMPISRLQENWETFLELWKLEESNPPERNPRAVRAAIINEMPRLAGRHDGLANDIVRFVTDKKIYDRIQSLEMRRLAALVHGTFALLPNECSKLAIEMCKTLSSRDQNQYKSLAKTVATLSMSDGVPKGVLQDIRELVEPIDFALVKRAVYQIDALLWSEELPPPYSAEYSEKFLDPDHLGILRCWLRAKPTDEWQELWHVFVAHSRTSRGVADFFSNWTRFVWDQLGKHPLEQDSDFSHRAFEFLADTVGEALSSENEDELFAAKKFCVYLQSQALLIEIYKRISDRTERFAKDQEFWDSLLPIRILVSGECADYSNATVALGISRLAKRKLRASALQILLTWPHLWKEIAGFLIQFNELYRLEVAIRRREIVPGPLASSSCAKLEADIQEGLQAEDPEVRQRAARMAFMSKSERMGINLEHGYIMARYLQEPDERTKSWLGICCLDFAESKEQCETGLKVLLNVCAHGDKFVRDKAARALVRLIVDKSLRFDVGDVIEALATNINLPKLHQAGRLVGDLTVSRPDEAEKIARFLLLGDVTNALGKTTLASFRHQARVPLMRWLRAQETKTVLDLIERVPDLDFEIGTLVADISLNPPHLNAALGALEELLERPDIDRVLVRNIGFLIRNRNASVQSLKVDAAA